MNVNGIKSTDYRLLSADTLVMTFVETSLDDIMQLDTSVLTVRTEQGTFVENFTGWQLCRVTFNIADNSYEVQFIPAIDEVTAATLNSLADKNAVLVEDLSKTQAQLDAAIQSNQMLEDCLVEMAEIVYA